MDTSVFMCVATGGGVVSERVTLSSQSSCRSLRVDTLLPHIHMEALTKSYLTIETYMN